VYLLLQLLISVTLKSASTSLSLSLLIEDQTLNTSLTLGGFSAADDLLNDPPTTSTRHYQAVLRANDTYRLTWNNATTTPNDIDLSIHNFPQ